MQAIRLLLVEGDMTTADVLADALADAGYDVTKTANGVEAAELLQDDGHELSGLITDLEFGAGPDGWRLARSAREKRPDMAVVYTAERGAEGWPVDGVPNSLVIAKPYAVGQIVAAIASLLNQNSVAPGGHA